MSGLPSSPLSVSIGLFGLSDSVWNGIALPLDLGFLGMPGCVLRNEILFMRVLGVGVSTSTWPLSIPSDPSLLGARFHLQALASDVEANPFGLVLTGQLSAEIGTR